MDICTPVPRAQVKATIKWELCCQPGQKRTDIISSISHIYPSSSLLESGMETWREPPKFVLENVILKFILWHNIDISEVCFCLWLCVFLFYLLASCIFLRFTKTVVTMGYSKINYSCLTSQYLHCPNLIFTKKNLTALKYLLFKIPQITSLPQEVKYRLLWQIWHQNM